MAKAIPHSYSSVPTIAHLISTYLSPPTESSLSVGLKVDIYFFLITQVRCIHRKFEKRKEIDMKKNHLPSLNQVVIFKKVSDKEIEEGPQNHPPSAHASHSYSLVLLHLETLLSKHL